MTRAVIAAPGKMAAAIVLMRGGSIVKRSTKTENRAPKRLSANIMNKSPADKNPKRNLCTERDLTIPHINVITPKQANPMGSRKIEDTR